MSDIFKYETPIWGARLICLIYFMVSALFFLASYTYDQWSANSPVAFKYFLLVLGFIFLFVSIKPSNHKGWVYFSANRNGMYFPSSFLKNKEGNSLHVTWDNVGEIKSETIYGGIKGLSIELSITQLEIDSYFKESNLANKILGFNQVRNGFFVVAFGNNSFQKVANVVSTLNKIRSVNI